MDAHATPRVRTPGRGDHLEFGGICVRSREQSRLLVSTEEERQ